MVDFGANVLALIGGHFVNSSVNGVVREQRLLRILFHPWSDH